MTESASNRQSVDLSNNWASVSAGPEQHISQPTLSQPNKVTSLAQIIMSTPPQSSKPNINSSTTHTFQPQDIKEDIRATIENAIDAPKPLLQGHIEEFDNGNMRGEVSANPPIGGGTVEASSLDDLKNINDKKADEAKEKKEQRLGRLKAYAIAKLVLSVGVTLLGAAIILGGIASMNPAVLLVSLGIGAALMAGGAYHTGKNLRELQGFKQDPHSSLKPEDYKRFDETTGKGDRKLDNNMKDIEMYEKFSKKFTPGGKLEEFYKKLEGTSLHIDANNYRKFVSVYDDVEKYIDAQKKDLVEVEKQIAQKKLALTQNPNSTQDQTDLANLMQRKDALEESLKGEALAKYTLVKMDALQEPEEGSEPLLHRGIDFVADRIVQPLKNKMISSLIGNQQNPAPAAGGAPNAGPAPAPAPAAAGGVPNAGPATAAPAPAPAGGIPASPAAPPIQPPGQQA